MVHHIKMISMNGRPDSGATSATAYKSGPRQGSSSAPSYAELRNPTLSATKISLDTNATTSLPLLIRPWLDGYEKQYSQGSLLFVNQDQQSHRMSTVTDLPTMNFMLEACQRQFGEDLVSAPMYKSCKTSRGLQGPNGWNFFGVLRNDMMADSTLQKLLNVDVFGRAMVANIFGKVCRGDHVGLALIRVNTAAIYNGFMQPAGNLQPKAIIKGMGPDGDGILQKGVLQFVPTVNGKINCIADCDNKDIDLHIPLGVITHAVGRQPNQGQRVSSLRSQTHYLLLPRIEILMI